MSYICAEHRAVAMADIGIYNWKQHSTGYLLAMYRSRYMHGWEFESAWFAYENDKENAHRHRVFWYQEWQQRVYDELKNRPHQTTKAERKKAKR